MSRDMWKIANTVIGLVRSKASGDKSMIINKDNIDNYNRLVEERNLSVQNTRKEIQERIESVCRFQNSIEIRDLGFETTSSHLFEDSWQEKVVKLLEKDEYKCIMTFRYTNGRLNSYLTVKW